MCVCDDFLTGRVRLIQMLICLVLFALPATAQTAAPTPQSLKPGETIERQIAGGEAAQFELPCSNGEYFKLTIDQLGIDIGARFPGPDDRPVLDFDADPRKSGQEAVEFVCSSDQNVKFSVEPRQRGAAPGRFAISFVESRFATDKDRALDEARRLLVSATRLWRAAKYTEALTLAFKCLEIRERELGTDHPDVGLALFTVGNVYSDIPDFPKAEEYYRRAIANRTGALGPDHVSLASIYNNYGLVYKDLGRYPEAIRMFERAREIRERSLDPTHLLIASVLNNLAIVHRLRGDEAYAEELYTRVLAIREKALGPDHPDVATSINNIVGPNWEPARAEAMYLRALAIRESKLPANHPEIAQSLYNLALLYTSTGQLEKGEIYSRRALQMFEASLGPRHPYVTLPMSLLANILKGKGEWVGSEAQFERTIALKEIAEGPFHPNLAMALANLADVYSQLGKTEKATAALTRANSIFDYNLRLNMSSGSEAEKLKYVDLLSKASELALSIAFDPKHPNRSFATVALESVLQRKGRVLDSMSDSVAMLRTRLDAEDRGLLDTWSETNDKISKLVLAGPVDEEIEAFRRRLLALESQKESIERRLSSRASAAVLESKSVSLDSVRKNLPAESVLLEFAVYRPVDRTKFEFLDIDSRVAASSLSPRYAAFVVSEKNGVEAFDLGEVSSIDGKLTQFRAALRDRNSSVKPLATRSGRLVFEPLRNAIGKAKRIFVSPDGDLSLVPFEALAGRNGRYLIQDFEFTYLTSGRDLLKKSESVARSEPVLIADPEFGDPGKYSKGAEAQRSVTVAADVSDTFFTPLSATEEEVEAIRSMYPVSRLLSKSDARESEVKKLSSPKFLHIATHGFFVENPVGLSGRGAEGTRSSVPLITKRNPLLRSGLALAGANIRNASDDDGILTALEVTGLDLRGTRLVVLSACDTGVGEVKTGEGVFGLRRAFQLAGAESLLMSLWPVSDQVTRDLMTGYYRNLKRGSGRGEALRRVQLDMLTKADRRHPFYWASFIHGGDWRPLDPGL